MDTNKMKTGVKNLQLKFISLCSAALLGLTFTILASSAQAESELKPAAANTVEVQLSTNYGDILIELDQVKAPLSSANFLAYVDKGFYDGTIFHRVIDGFMIQGGGFDESLKKKPTQPPIKNEANNGLANVRGSLAMARTNAVNSATSQFFINLVDNKYLDHSTRNFGYAVFGKVVSGMDVVDKIAGTKTGNKNGMANVPTKAVVILSAKRKK